MLKFLLEKKNNLKILKIKLIYYFNFILLVHDISKDDNDNFV